MLHVIHANCWLLFAEDDAPPGDVRDEAAPSADYFDQLRELLEAEYQR